MKRKLLLFALMLMLMSLALASFVYADGIKRFETDEFQSGDNITYFEGVNTDAYLTDTSRNQDITEWIDNDKHFARAVLKNSDGTYTTYPAWYVFNLKYDWQGSYQQSTVERLNAFTDITGEAYEKTDIVRIEYLEFTEAALKNIRKGTGTPEFFPNAKYVRIPSHFTGISFFNGYEVETIEFAPGINITNIGQAAVLNCYKLKELILPNTVVSITKEGINFYTKQNESALQVLNLGASITTLGAKNSVGNCRVPGIKVILSRTLDGSVYNHEYFPSNGTVLYTGTREQAEAFGYDICISYTEYLEMGEPSGKMIVYGYNHCEAFYGGQHEEFTDISGCQYGCPRCGDAVIKENPTHDFVMTKSYGENKYLEAITVLEQCTACKTKTVEETVAPFFTCMGYSFNTFSESVEIVQGFFVNREAVKRYYDLTGSLVELGVLATGNASGEEREVSLSDDKVFSSSLNALVHDYYQIRVSGVWDESIKACKIIMCTYVIEDGEMLFIDAVRSVAEDGTVSYSGVTKSTALGISYNELLD